MPLSIDGFDEANQILQLDFNIFRQSDAATFMLVASDAWVIKGAIKIGFHDILNLSRAAAHYFYLIVAQNIYRTIAHVASQHDFNTYIM